MSLRVWLPLDGSLRNLGISNLKFTAISNNTIVSNNGKIGKCYTNNSYTDGGLISDRPILLGDNYSMCCWFKFTNLDSNSSLGGTLVSQHRYGQHTGFGLTIRYVSATTGYLSVNTGDGRTRTYNTYYGTTLLQANTWYHACGTYDGTNIRIYLNGVLETIQAYPMSSPEDYILVFAWSLSGLGTEVYSNHKLNGAINDVRIYDHCLSQTEIKAIAQGLVLHYKLDQERIIDSSGYGHHGIVVGNSIIEENSPRYNYCINLPAAADKINCGRGGMVTDGITVNFWLKSTSWANPISCTESGGWNFEASGDYFRFPVNISGGVGYKYGTSATTRATICNNQWHMMTGVYDRIEGHVKIYVDGELDNDYNANTHNEIRYHASNSIWVGAEAIGSATTANNGMIGNFSDLRIYCTALSDDDIKQLYNTPMKIDDHKNIHTFVFTENDKNKLQKYGSLDCAQIHQWPLTNFLHCDHTIYTEPDGSKWVHIFHHNNPAASKFATTDTFTTYVYKSEDQWFDVAVCDHAPQWELMVKQLSKTNLNQKYRWIQSVNPMTATYAQVAANLITRNTSNEYTQFSIGGLYKKNASVYISSNTGTASSWWGGIGCFKNDYQGGIPGFGGNSNTDNVVTTGYIDLYLRIDNLDLPVKNFDTFDWYADGYIER